MGDWGALVTQIVLKDNMMLGLIWASGNMHKYRSWVYYRLEYGVFIRVLLVEHTYVPSHAFLYH